MSMPFPEVPRVDPDEVKRRLDAGEQIIIVDIRKPEVYAAHHIAGARSIPLATILEVIRFSTSGGPPHKSWLRAGRRCLLTGVRSSARAVRTRPQLLFQNGVPLDRYAACLAHEVIKRS